MPHNSHIYRDMPTTHVGLKTPGMSGLVIKWVIRYLESLGHAIPTLPEGALPCPGHTPAYRQYGKLWLMGPNFMRWLTAHHGICPKQGIKYLELIGASHGFVYYPERLERFPVICLPAGGSYAFTADSIILRGQVHDSGERQDQAMPDQPVPGSDS